MRTDKKRKIYQFTELSEQAQEMAINSVREYTNNYECTQLRIVKILTDDLYEFNPDGSIYFELN